MANEIQITLVVNVTNGNFRDNINPGSMSITQSAIGMASGIQAVGTSAEAIVTTDVTNLGWGYFKNLDSTNFVLIGPDDGGTMKDFGKLLAGEACLIPLKPGITIKAKADTATCKLEYKIYER